MLDYIIGVKIFTLSIIYQIFRNIDIGSNFFKKV